MFSNRHLFCAAVLLLPLCLALSTTPVVADDDAITECGTVITQPGEYEVEHDLLLCPGSNPVNPQGAITIAASHVELNLEGHTVSCDTNTVPGLESYGIVVSPGLRNVQIKNGTVTGCNVGIWVVDNRNSSVRNMVVTDIRWSVPRTFVSGRGILANHTQKLKIIGNRVSGTEHVGINVFNSDGARVSRNTVTETYAGIVGAETQNTKFFCNIANRNLLTGMELLGLPGTTTGNVLRGNVTNNNGLAGIVIYGDADNPVERPIPEDNTVHNNIALGNGLFDLTELFFGFTTGIITLDDVCHNTWKNNEFMTGFGPPMCIGVPVQLDDGDVCAFDDEDDSDD